MGTKERCDQLNLSYEALVHNKLRKKRLEGKLRMAFEYQARDPLVHDQRQAYEERGQETATWGSENLELGLKKPVLRGPVFLNTSG